MRIARVRARNVGFSRAPTTLKRNLVTSASVLEDFGERPQGWFGPTVCTLVEVETEDGARGIGTAGALSGAAKGIVEQYLADLVAGEDPRRHEALWQRMYRPLVRFGRSGAAVTAISAVDIACWDLHGRAEGRTVADLLGGRTRSTAPCYVSRCYALEDLDALAAEASGYVDDGFDRLKQRFGFGPIDGPKGLARNRQLVETVRAAVGPDVELAADAYMGWDRPYAHEMAVRLRDLRLSWIEEPLLPHDVDGYADLRARTPWQRWSAGEHSYTKWDFQELLAKRAVDLLQPDVNRMGGLTEARKVCALAEAAGVPVVPHSNEAHNLHLVFSQSPHVCPLVEYFPDVEPDTGNELFWRLFDGNAVARNGEIALPDRPGLGIEVDEDVVAGLLVEDGAWLPA